MKKNYTVGFIFTQDLQKILLVHKQNPEWQRGKVNAVGGKIEPAEEPVDCMVREVKEETSLEIEQENWVPLGTITNADSSMVHLFITIYSGDIRDAVAADYEKIEWFPVGNLPQNLMTNLTWLIPLAIDKLRNKEVKEIAVVNAG